MILNLSSAAISVPEFVSSALSVLEGISQHPSLLIENNEVIMKDILPCLASLIACQNGTFLIFLYGVYSFKWNSDCNSLFDFQYLV